MTNSTMKQSAGDEVLSVEAAAELLIQYVNQLRADAGVDEEQEISIYVTSVPLIHSALTEMGDYIREQTNAVDVVQVNVKAGNPMPAHLKQIEVHEFDQGPASIGIDVQGDE